LALAGGVLPGAQLWGGGAQGPGAVAAGACVRGPDPPGPACAARVRPEWTLRTLSIRLQAGSLARRRGWIRPGAYAARWPRPRPCTGTRTPELGSASLREIKQKGGR